MIFFFLGRTCLTSRPDRHHTSRAVLSTRLFRFVLRSSLRTYSFYSSSLPPHDPPRIRTLPPPTQRFHTSLGLQDSLELDPFPVVQLPGPPGGVGLRELAGHRGPGGKHYCFATLLSMGER